MAVVDEPAGARRSVPWQDSRRDLRREERPESLFIRIRDWLPRGNLLDDAVWQKRHDLLQLFLLLHLPALVLFGLWMAHSPGMVLITVAPIPVCWGLARLRTGRRLASFFTTAGIIYCSAALVVLANGAIEAHFHFFIVIGFIALYQDWVPFGWDIAFTVLSHGIGSAFKPNLIFNTMDGMHNPWLWSLVHGAAVLMACIGVVLFWRTNEDEQQNTLRLTKALGEAEVNRRKFTSDLLVNLARRNQSMLYRQLDIINQLEEKERDPDALAELFRLDHLATRIRRNAENLLVLSGEEPPRVWGKPVALTDVVRAAIAETEDLSRVVFVVDERLSVLGHAVIDLTHLLAELIENAVRSSPPESRVTIRTTPDVRAPGTVMLTVEDWGVGMPAAELAEANEVLAAPRDVDAMVSNRLGLHVVSRLAHRYSIKVMLSATSGSGITSVVLLPPELFTVTERPASAPEPFGSGSIPLAPRPALPSAPGPQRRPPAPAMAAPPGPSATPYQPPPPFQASTPFQPPAPFQAPRLPQDQPQSPAPSAQSPAPASGGLPSIQVERLTSGPRWDGWWEPEDEPVRAAESARTAESAYGGPGTADRDRTPPAGIVRGVALPEPDTTDAPVRLTRRTPQAHLAPELQRERQATVRAQSAVAAPAAAPAGPDAAARAREALSRYQASRQAALAEHAPPERNRS
jgi:hypothetical protein